MDPVTLGVLVAVPLLWLLLSGGSSGDDSDGDDHGSDLDEVDTDLESIRDLQRD